MRDEMTGWLPDQDLLIELFDVPSARWAAVLVAVAVGAAHALAPGHGKSITAAYLVGVHGRTRDALALGWIVAVMHTLSVLVLAVGWVAMSASTVGTEWLTAWMQVAASLVVTAVGVRLLRHQRRTAASSCSPAAPVARVPALAGSAHAAHGHGHGGGHGGGHVHGEVHVHGHGTGQHTHLPAAGVDPWSRRGLVTLGASGGLLPSPSAFLVLVSGVVSGRLTDALLLVVAFAIGMAATLSGVGVLTVKGRDLALRSTRRWRAGATVQRLLPRLAAAGVVALGLTYLALSLPPALGA